MCGIAGFFGRKKISEGILSNALLSMNSRGPDSSGTHRALTSSGMSCTLLHTRLQIIDLDERSSQPFKIDNKVIVFNGEIYNYIELRKDLIDMGVNLRTDSDTEVLLQYYILYGRKCVEYFEGMWAFAIYDGDDETLFISRDRFAEKPIFTYTSSEGFYFASEIKTLSVLAGCKFSIDYDQVNRFLVNGHKSIYKKSSSFFKEIKSLDFSENLWVTNSLEVSREKYWKPAFQPDRNIALVDAIDQVRDLLSKSVKIRMRADVPLAFCLSGGVDSSSMVSIASKILNKDVTTFSIIDNDERYNELENIDRTIQDTGCKNEKVYLGKCKGLSALDRIAKQVSYRSAPTATISYFVHNLLTEKIKERGFKVSISGTGADEIFSGYYDHFNMHMCSLQEQERDLAKSNWIEHQSKIVRNPYLSDPDIFFKNPKFRDHIYLNNRKFADFLKPEFKELKFQENYFCDDLLRNRMMNEMFYEVVRVILFEDDQNSMQYSIENRSPFLDSKLFEFMGKVPTRHLIQDGYAKFILREAMSGILNDKVRLSREKKGFNASIRSIINFDDASQLSAFLDPGPIFDIVNKKKLEGILSEDYYTNSYKKFLFSFLNMRMFLDKF